jgi:hypothetical protein
LRSSSACCWGRGSSRFAFAKNNAGLRTILQITSNCISGFNLLMTATRTLKGPRYCWATFLVPVLSAC